MKIRAVFLDRDGTINKDPGYFHNSDKLELYSGITKGLKLINHYFDFFVVQNQGGIGEGIFTLEDMTKVNDSINNILKKGGLEIKKFYYCPHSKNDGCICRKPSTYLVLKAAQENNICLNNSWLIGDMTIDSQLAENIRKEGYQDFKMILVNTGEKGLDKRFQAKPDYIANNFLNAAEIIYNKIDNKEQ